jgi:hypothetical protein
MSSNTHAQLIRASSRKKHDPDTPSLHQAHYCEDFLEAMEKDIQEVEAHGIWTIVKKSSLPEGANVLPSTRDSRSKGIQMGAFASTKQGFEKSTSPTHSSKTLLMTISTSESHQCLSLMKMKVIMK